MTNELLEALLAKAANHVVVNIFNRRVVERSSYTLKAYSGSRECYAEDAICSAIRFSGALDGLMCTHAPIPTLRTMALEYLGIEEFELDFGKGQQVLTDAAGELTNMIAGTIRNMLAGKQVHCRITPPKPFANTDEMVRRLGHHRELGIIWIKFGELYLGASLLTIPEASLSR